MYLARKLIGASANNLAANAVSLWDNVAANVLTRGGWSEPISGPTTDARLIWLFSCLTFLLGLLFLLVKERRLYGSMQVSIQGPGLSHSTYIPVNGEIQIFQINNSVDWIRGQVARLSA